MNLTKEGKYSENYDILMKEIKNDAKKSKDTLCSWTEHINIVKIVMLSKAIYRFNAIPIKILMMFFIELE